MRIFFNTLSNVSQFFIEKRFVYRGLKNKPEGSSDSSDPFGDSSINIPLSPKEKALQQGGIWCKSGDKKCFRKLKRLEEKNRRTKLNDKIVDAKKTGERPQGYPAMQEIKDILSGKSKLPNGFNVWKDAFFKKLIAQYVRKYAGVTDAEVMREVSKRVARGDDQTAETYIREELEDARFKKVLPKFKLALKSMEKSTYKLLVSLYVSLYAYKNSEDTVTAKKALGEFKKELQRNRRVMAYLPNLKSEPTVIAKKGRGGAHIKA